ncbi:unnamed protein product [Protopolystoma xenopodis]|uniref:Uncharacterized protein n=1 Tax=Protopolystoma xenopodis TaxID=117903 RepID=A0A448XCE3_9PLAT|nr:unnamed protein product [Protopolystoma xenopodis]
MRSNRCLQIYTSPQIRTGYRLIPWPTGAQPLSSTMRGTSRAHFDSNARDQDGDIFPLIPQAPRSIPALAADGTRMKRDNPSSFVRRTRYVSQDALITSDDLDNFTHLKFSEPKLCRSMNMDTFGASSRHGIHTNTFLRLHQTPNNLAT